MTWRWQNFTPQEMGCASPDGSEMDPAFMDRLQLLRTLLAQPLVISSGYRSPERDAQLSGGGAHPLGIAADIRCHGHLAYDIEALAYRLGFTGLGRAQEPTRAHSRRFIHLDIAPPGGKFPRPWIWSY